MTRFVAILAFATVLATSAHAAERYFGADLSFANEMDALGMKVLLDFHYSDTWADGHTQIIPAAWAHISDPRQLTRALHG